MNYCKLGPGPASVNLRDVYGSTKTTTLGENKIPHKYISKSGKFNCEKRYIGQPSVNYANPGVATYNEEQALTANHTSAQTGKNGT